MSIATNKLALAAFAGLFSVGVMTTNIVHAAEHSGTDTVTEKSACKGANGCKGEGAEGEKHACKGMNACKGQGADGKNECKGHGSCATDGSAG